MGRECQGKTKGSLLGPYGAGMAQVKTVQNFMVAPPGGAGVFEGVVGVRGRKIKPPRILWNFYTFRSCYGKYICMCLDPFCLYRSSESYFFRLPGLDTLKVFGILSPW